MAAQVVLQVFDSDVPQKEYVFRDRTRCALGRAEDCFLQLPHEPRFLGISRHHCLFDIDPPVIRVRDLGSRNGTFLNGQKIGQRGRQEAPEIMPAEGMPQFEMKDGDELRVGCLVLRVRVAEMLLEAGQGENATAYA